MLPIPILLFLLFSTTLVAPVPRILDGLKITFSFEWSTLPSSIPSQSPLEETVLSSVSTPSVTLDPLPTQPGPTSLHVADKTIPDSFVHATDYRTTITAVLIVALLALLNCLVYKLLVKPKSRHRVLNPEVRRNGIEKNKSKSNGTRDAEESSERPTVPPSSAPAAPPPQEYHTQTVNEPRFRPVNPVPPFSTRAAPPPQELMYYRTQTFNEMPPHFLPVNQVPPFSTHVAPPPQGSMGYRTQTVNQMPPHFLPANPVPPFSTPTAPPPQESMYYRTQTVNEMPPHFLPVNPVPPIVTPVAPPPQESMCYRTQTVNEMPPHFLPVDPAQLIPESLEHGGLPHSAEGSTISYIETTIVYETVDPSGQSPPFSGPQTFPASGPPLGFLSEPCGKQLQDDSMSAYIEEIEDDRVSDADADEQVMFHYQPSKSGDDGDETFDYKEVECTPEAPRTPPAPATEDQALPSPHLIPSSRSRSHSLGCAPSLPANKTSSEVSVTRSSPSRRFSLPPDITTNWAAAECSARYALDDIQVGTKGQSRDEIISITRCASVDDFSGTSETVPAHAFTNPDHDSQILPCDNIDDTAPNQATLLSADALTFKPSSGMYEVIYLAEPRCPVSEGLKASIHAPRNEGVSPAQGCAGVPGSMDTPTPPMTRSSPTANGLSASMHAPARCLQSQSARSTKHHPDVPNWAAISRAQNSDEGDGDASELVPTTTTRCAARGHEGRRSLDNSDGPLVYFVDDLEEGSVSTTSSGETDPDSTLCGEAEADDDQNEQDGKPSRRTRRRRRPRQKVPYVPPPRMRNLAAADVYATTNTLAPPPPPAPPHMQHPYTNAPPPPSLPHHPISPSGPMMIPPNGIIYDQFGRPVPPHPHPHPHSRPYVEPIPGFQPPYPRFYPHQPQPLHVFPQPPSTPPYGR